MNDDERGLPHPVTSRRGTLLLLAVATAVGSAGLAAGGTAGALLGEQITGTEAAAGLPLGVLVGGQAVAALLISAATVRLGRGLSLALGYGLGVAGAVLVIVAAVESNFAALLAGSAVLGAGNAAVFLTRYAAAEVGGDARGAALGVVLSAAALGAVASPNLLGPGGKLAGLLGLPPLAGLYVVAIPCFSMAAILLASGGGDAPRKIEKRHPLSRRVGLSALSAHATQASCLILAASNIVMVAVMAVAPVHLAAHGHGLGTVGVIVAVHVAGMFLPSPVSGWMADRVGPAPVAVSGLALIAVSGIAGFVLDTGGTIPATAVLLTLGMGWNLGVVGGSTLLAASVPAPLRSHAEGLGEVSMGFAAAVGAPAAGLVLALKGFAVLSVAGAVTAATAAIAVVLVRRVFW